ncbi:hypothetical protein ES703_93215 [subsurface metagenome]
MEKEHWGYKEVGYKYTTGTRFITATEVDIFCDISGMRADVFISDEVAKASGARGRVVPGPLLMGIVFGLLGETGLTSSGMLLGVNNTKFNVLVYPYDEVRLEGEILNKKVTSKGDRVIVTYSWSMRNQDDVVVAQGENACISPNPEWTG